MNKPEIIYCNLNKSCRWCENNIKINNKLCLSYAYNDRLSSVELHKSTLEINIWNVVNNENI